MRVLIITPEYQSYGGGIATFYRNAVPEFRRHVSVNLIVGSGFNFNEEIANDQAYAFLSPKLVRDWYNKLTHLAATPTLRRLLAAAWASWDLARQAGRFDVIETTDFGLLHVPHALQPLAPTIVRAHGSWGQIGMHQRGIGQEIEQGLALALETETMRHMAARYSHSETNAEWWESQSAGQFNMIRPCWRPLFHDNSCEKVDPVIRVFGRIQAWKGPHVVAEAWKKAPDLPDVEWYGRDVAINMRGGSTNEALRTAYPGVWGCSIRPQATVAPVEVARLNARALLNLIPSTWDVFNFTAVEAMASGRPVICSNKAGASELIEEGRTGFIYDGNSYASLVEAIRRALALGPKRLARVGADAREAVTIELNPERQVHVHLTAYAAVIASACNEPFLIPAWLRELATPRELSVTVGHYLDQQPLRELVTYVFERTLRKLKVKN